MDGPLKIYGLIIFSILILIMSLFVNNMIITKDEMFNVTRTNQIQIVKEAINIGDLIVNNKLSINESYIEQNWFKHFENNIDTKNNYEIELLNVSSYPPLVAIKIKPKNSNVESYSNVIILEEGD